MIDPTKMDAFVNEGTPPPEGEEEGPPGEELGGEGAGEGNIEKYAKLIPALEEFAEDVQDTCDDMDADALADTSQPLEPDDQQILVDGVSGLDRGLQKELKTAAQGGIPMEDATYVAQHLVDEGKFEDAEQLAGWLFRVGAALSGEGVEGAEEDEEIPSEPGMEGEGEELPPSGP